MSKSVATLHLASASPRRAEILRSLGLDFTSGAAAIDETPYENESAATLVVRLAREKAAAAARPGLVLGADTVVTLGEEIFGKPRSQTDCETMLERLSGRCHRVLTGVALLKDGQAATAMSSTEVRFREIRPDEARAYWQSGEPCDKAGSYAIQGIGGSFVEHISGSYSGVVGLPVFETVQLLSAAGLDVLNFVGTAAAPEAQE